MSGSGSTASLKTESTAESLSTARIVTSNWDKFCLLLWKNWLVQWQHKLMLVFEIIMPVIYTLILVVFRASLVPERVPVMDYTDIPVNNLDILISYLNNSLPVNITWGLAYSPASPVFKNIMEEVQFELKIPDLVNKPNSAALEEYCLSNNMIACVEFPDNLSQDFTYPNNFKYSLRFPSDLRTASRLSTDNWETNQLFPTFIIRGSRNTFDDDGGLPPGYIREGFIPLQNAINRAYISQVKESVTHKATNVTDLPEVFMHRYPYPSFMQDYFLEALEIWLPFIILVSFLYPCTFGVKAVTVEKEQQLKEVMKIMGLDSWLHWVAWFVKSFSILFISSALIVIILKVPWTDGAAVLTSTNWFALFILLLIYSVVSVSFAFMISVFFSNASTAAAVTALLWFVCYLPYAFTVSNYNTLTLGAKMACSLLSNSAMGFAFTLIIQWEGIGDGLQWDNFFTPPTPDDTFSIGLSMVMMLVATVLYLIICIYVEQIMPGEFGVPKKWYFPFTKSYWFNKKSNIDDEIQTNGIEQQNHFEYVAPGKYAGLKIRNLRKTFGKKVAVKGVNLNMYENEITVLLGHNGAGKTTTISMLTGMFPPTSGTAVINESDIRTQIENARQSLGICPQHNILFDELTVREHIIFFSWLKGVRKNNLNAEVEKYTKVLQLEDKIDTPSCKLSGGMKRKLSVGSAFCGGTKVVLCDEPSSGMDPSARRQMWDLLQSEKAGRTVLLTTHFMDEADVLGDRIAIMGEGEVKCYGTSFFLKKQFGSGYVLTCVKTELCDSSNVTLLLRKYIPTLKIQQEIGAELSYQLPDDYTHKFEDMLSDLEKHSSDLYLNGYGISNSSLEEVFMKMGAENHEDQKENTGVITNLFGAEVAPLLQGYKLQLNQWRAMFLKKYIYSARNWIMVAIQFIIPLIFVILTIEIAESQSTYRTLKALNISLLDYKNTMTILSSNYTVGAGTLLGDTIDHYSDILSSQPSEYQYETIDIPFPKYLLNLAETKIVDINTKYMVAASIGPKNITAWFNNQPYHTAPLSLNLIHNAMLRAYMGSKDYSIEVINHPLPFGAMTEFQQLASGNNLGTQLSSNLCFCMSFITSLVALYIIRERVTRAKLLQYVAGIRIPIFWITQFLWDYFLLVITSLLIILVIACFQEAGYTTFSELGKNFAVLLIFGLPAIPWTYLLTKYFDEPAAGFARISMINLIVGLIFFILVTVLASPIYNDKDTADGLSWFFMIFPHFSLAQSLNKLSTNIITHSICDNMCNLIGSKDSCNMTLICEKTPTCCEMVPYWGWEEPGILPETIYMFVTFLVFFTILVLREMKMLGQVSGLIMEKYKGKPQLPEPAFKIDDDVLNEKYRVAAMTDCELELQNLVLDRATKFYDRFLAVNQISVAVKPMECFGLLGVNGAGKTTTFKLMTGDEALSSGNGYVEGLSIITDMRNVYKKLGYCPQFDALLGDLSGRETIRIFGMIRGLTPTAIDAVTKTLSEAFGFKKHIDKPVKAYSGGNKRKLSTAVALIGNPSIVFLDEPTSGMDPASRRNLWNVVCAVRDSGKSIVLTSHSMEECEALCTRLAIMVNGEFKCLGSTQHLKNKFSRGIILKMKLKRQMTSQDDEINYKHFMTDLQNINEFISCHFPEAKLQEQYQGILTYCIPLTSIKWSTIFGLMERNRHRFNIEDYSINQTTLEEIFLEFAKHQREEDTRDYSQSKGCFSCYQRKK